MDSTSIRAHAEQLVARFVDWVSSPLFYSQLGMVLLAIVSAWSVTMFLRRYSTLLAEPPRSGALHIVRHGVYQLRELLFPLFIILFTALAVDLSEYFFQQSWLVRVAEGLAVVLMIFSLIGRFISNPLLKNSIRVIVVPIALLQVFDGLDDVVGYLEAQAVEIGNITISAYGIIRVLIFGALLFWLGQLLNNVGQRVIRQLENLDAGTREIFAKVYQVVLFVVICILLLQVMGINITALAVFGGALGVGLGFGLQSIASNFISGVILLLDRSLAIGDYIELEDGRMGTIRELNMRYTMLETYDGKEIMVPNEMFITTSFTNWTHSNKKQRYALEFQVAYSTDLHRLFPLLREVVASHPKVLSGAERPVEELPDAEIKGFGESGVDILIEFWMEGIDDGENRVGADLLLMIWDALREHGVEIPFPQREVKIVRVGADANAPAAG